MDFYSIDVLDSKGEKVSLSNYKGKALLIINSATGCIFTPQYKQLQELYEKYNRQGFDILDFPCNQFGNQAPGSADEIHEFCFGRFGVSFPQFAKIEVNGENASPLFKYLKTKKSGFLNSEIKWNFTKFLVDKNGDVIKRYRSSDGFADIEEDLVKIL